MLAASAYSSSASYASVAAWTLMPATAGFFANIFATEFRSGAAGIPSSLSERVTAMVLYSLTNPPSFGSPVLSASFASISLNGTGYRETPALRAHCRAPATVRSAPLSSSRPCSLSSNGPSSVWTRSVPTCSSSESYIMPPPACTSS